ADMVRAQAAWKHRDPMIGVVLAQILSTAIPQLPEAIRVLRPVELPVDAVYYARIEPNSMYTRYSQDQALYWLATLTQNRLLPLLAVEQIDVDALRLLGLFRGGPGEAAAGVDLADLYNVMVSPALSDVIDFSMELLPSILEVKRDAGQQTFSIDGYASVERRGNLDDLVLSQLALDEDLFEQRLVDNELFYFTHEKQVENEQRTHYVLVDGSASMRGVREVFARGLALALCKRLALLGETVVLRFFDSRLYDGVRVGASGSGEVPYVLQFRAERGRNYARVLRQLNSELASPRRAGKALIYLLTHGECQLPSEEVATLAARAPVYGVFILPSGPLDLGYLDHLYRVHVIDNEALSRHRRVQKARQIIDDVESLHMQATRARRPARPRRGKRGRR
ncbi:MAG: vWA domain-containing protein, partial [Nannocystaceae bacterium]